MFLLLFWFARYSPVKLHCFLNIGLIVNMNPLFYFKVLRTQQYQILFDVIITTEPPSVTFKTICPS